MHDHRCKWKGSRNIGQKDLWSAKRGLPCAVTGLKKIFVLTDAMEQAKLSLPHFPRMTGKQIDHMMRQDQRVIAVLVPGVIELYYVLGPEHKKGANATIEVFSRMLRELERECRLDEFPQLDIVGDNCGGDNKNKHVRANVRAFGAHRAGLKGLPALK
jgi:hypothetical protein